jgi:hypothetical protein
MAFELRSGSAERSWQIERTVASVSAWNGAVGLKGEAVDSSADALPLHAMVAPGARRRSRSGKPAPAAALTAQERPVLSYLSPTAAIRW